MGDMRYAVINRTTRLVENVIEADSDWVDPDGRRIVPSDAANRGDSFNATTKEFTPGPAPVVTPTAAEVRQTEYAALLTDAARLVYIAEHLDLVVPDDQEE